MLSIGLPKQHAVYVHQVQAEPVMLAAAWRWNPLGGAATAPSLLELRTIYLDLCSLRSPVACRWTSAVTPALLSPPLHPTTSLSPLQSAAFHEPAEAPAGLLLLLWSTVSCPCCLQRSMSLQRHQADSEAHLLEESRAARAALQEQLRTLQGQFAAKQEAEQAASSELGRLRQQLSAAQSAAATSESARQQLGAQLQAAQHSVELLQQQVTQSRWTGHPAAVPCRSLPGSAVTLSCPTEWLEHLYSSQPSCCRCEPSGECSLC